MSSVATQLPKFLYSQFFRTPRYPDTDCTGRTIVVTGGNIGLGKETARHLVRLNAARVIITSRDTSKGEAAVKDIEQSTGRKGVVEVWNLDLQDYNNIKAFAERVNRLQRLDAVVENAGILAKDFKAVGGHESTITVNVVGTFLLALLVLPKLQETARRFNIVPKLTIVSSEVHFFTAFPEHKSSSIFATLDDPKTANMSDRYNISKLLEVFVCRHIARHNPVSKLHVTVNFVNPGLCHSELAREVRNPVLMLFMALIARSTEVGGRSLVYAAVTAGEETHGKYLSDCEISKCAKIVENDRGAELETRVWKELSEALEQIQPGVTQIVAA